MSVRRREFLGALAAGVMVFGLDRLASAGDDAAAPAKKDEPPAWFKEALARMKETKTPGVAIVLPSTKDAREKLRGQIESLLRNADQAAQAHLLEAVYVVVDGCHVAAKAGETAVLLESDGKRAAGAAVVFTPEEFAAGVHPLLRDGDRLAKRAKAARTDEVEKRLADLVAFDPAKSEPATEWLTAQFAYVAPVVIEGAEIKTPGDTLQVRLRRVIEMLFAVRMRGARPLPFGAAWKAGPVPEPKEDPCPGCGMMIRRPHEFDVLELLAQEARTTK